MASQGRPRHLLRREGERLLREGIPARRVATMLGVSNSTTHEWRVKLGIPHSRQKVDEFLSSYRPPPGLMVEESAPEMPIPLSVASPPEPLRNPNSIRSQEDRAAGGAPSDPIPLDRLCPEAKWALKDFEYFRRRYFGRISTPWQIEAGNEISAALDRPGQDLYVINCPPGAGKSTLLHDVVCWVICRDRSVRILWLTASGRLVSHYTLRVRRSLERRYRIKDTKLIAAGMAVEAKATLPDDFGRFRPEVIELWRAEEFTVEQLDGSSLENKEPTVAGYGFRGDFIGHRCNLLIPDDVATKTNSREGADRTALIELWDDVIEARLEPDGVLPLTGQRLSAVDLYMHCLGQTMGDDDDVEGDFVAGPRPVYKHIVYPAYFPDLDGGPESRRPDAPPWPEGPLLDPRRIPWRKLSGLRQNKPDTFALTYQQESGVQSDVLVRDVWAFGGTSAEGEMFPGCIDRGRRLGEIPADLAPPVLSVASIDPGVAKNWAFVWELYQPEVDYRHVIGLHRGSMSAENVLSWDLANRETAGLMVEWQLRSVELGYPITHWIIESNIAQHMLSFGHVKRFLSDHRVTIIRHTTTRYNKDHDEFGIAAIIPPIWRNGRIRLPDRAACYQVEAFIHEHRTWRHGKISGTDYVMAGWFPELHWPKVIPAGVPTPIHTIPEFLHHPYMRTRSA